MARRAAALRVVNQDGDAEYEARLDDVRDFAASLPERFLYCREMGHNWKPFSAGRYKDGGLKRVLRCTRCKTQKHQQISNRGMLGSTHYEHPEGYLTNGIGHIVGEGRGVLRLASIERFGVTDIDDDEE